MEPSQGSWLAQILTDIKSAGGQPFLVGGAVRDKIIFGDSHKPKDLDFEIYGIPLAKLQSILEIHGAVDLVGKSFGVFKLAGFQNVEFSLPRRDSKVGAGHKGFEAALDPFMLPNDASRRRDLTMNALMMDPLTGRICDFHGGQQDIKEGIMRAVDANTFLDDPLRALRVAQFVSRFKMGADMPLVQLCNRARLGELPGERIFAELNKLLLGANPNNGLICLELTGMIRWFPELAALIGCQQDHNWHPEGDVFVHTKLAVQRAREITDNLTVLWAVLCHDLGKPSTTKFEDGHIRSKEHEEAGVPIARAFLERLRAPNEMIDSVCALVGRHLAPAHFYGLARARGEGGRISQAGPGAFRRLARELSRAGTDIKTLELVARADHFGRTTPEALERKFPAGDWFLERASKIEVNDKPEPDVVMGRHLLDRGMVPGPEFGRILTKCRDIQYETGIKDAELILEKVLCP